MQILMHSPVSLYQSIYLSIYLCTHIPSQHSYIIVKEDKSLESYGLNAVCTHLGCVVPWSAANNKFMCPCHGSQYAPTGAVVRGPAPLPLALAHCDVGEDGKIYFSPWVEDDFRTGGKGWWN
jgi:cytochrome b6-f complex iron-sulfur subunit